MLIEFSFENYRSFASEGAFSLLATKLKSRDKEVDRRALIEREGLPPVLRAAVIYGANSSGKSNVISALRRASRYVLNSSEFRVLTPFDPFLLSDSNAGDSSRFQFVFAVSDTIYKYEFAVVPHRVIFEELFRLRGTKEEPIFSRRETVYKLHSGIADAEPLTKRTRDDVLFLNIAAQFNNGIATGILTWFKNIVVLTGLNDRAPTERTISCLTDGQHSEAVGAFLANLDLGFSTVEIESDDDDISPTLNEGLLDEPRRSIAPPNRFRSSMVKTMHTGRTIDGKPKVTWLGLRDHESQGSQKAFSLAGPIVLALAEGSVLVIDEFDARLHPVMTRSIIRLFNDPEVNSRNAQLVVATHDSNLLSRTELRRDQIWFVEKDRSESSHLYSLAELRVRNDSSFEDDYLRGRYGAIPFVGTFRNLQTFSTRTSSNIDDPDLFDSVDE